ncbi:MAG: cadherin-like domain-containing protein [Syntrophorhabdaceae bacterium]|nr:cadherin-like domain-containing protein [Syntrophorhabdaceae bacterium]
MPTKIRRRIKYVPPPKKKLFDAKSIAFIVIFLAAFITYMIYSGSEKKGEVPAKAAQTAAGKIESQEAQSFEAKADVPSVTKAKLQVESIENMDKLKVVAEGNTIGNVPVSFRYEWTKNGQPVEGGGDSISGFKRGDRIIVKITPYLGEMAGLPRMLSTEIKNSTPKVTEDKQVVFEGNIMKYQVKATDPDGDKLTYALEAAPQGMTIDSNTGLVQWPVKEDFSGKVDFKVKISDGNGGEISYALSTNIEKPIEKPAQKAAPAKK